MRKISIEPFAKQLIDDMYKNYDYTIEDFSLIKGISVPWGLSKILQNGTKINILFLSYDDDVLNINSDSNIYDIIDVKKEKIVKIILIGEDIDDSEVRSKLNYLNDFKGIENNSIIIDLIHSTIQISDSSIEEIAKQINSIVSVNSRAKQNKINSVATYTLIGINIFMFIISVILNGGNPIDINNYVLVMLGAKYNTAIIQGQWFRLLTCTFLHGGLLHIAANMYSLYSVGPLVESLYGKYKYIFMYLIAGIVSSLFSFLFSTGISIGASGSIFGLLGIILVFALKKKKTLGRKFLMNVSSVIAVNLLIGFSLPGIDNFAHLGGLFAGIFLALIIRTSENTNRDG